MDEHVVVERDCEATLIPFGNKITLKKGEEGHITQALGGSYTVMVRGNLVRVEGIDADAIGKIPEVQPWLEETESDGKAWLAQVFDEWKELGRDPKDFLESLALNTRNRPFTDCNFLKKPFLDACQAKGLFDALPPVQP